MTYLISLPLLAPLLLAQGWLVRRRTPRLPEPPGPRAGALGAGPRLRVLIVGDSAAAGVGAPSHDTALAGQLAHALAPDYRVQWALLAATGATTQTTLDCLRQRPAEAFDFALTILGVNDVTSGVRAGRWRQQQARLRELLHSRFQVGHVLVCGVPPMARFPALPQPLRWFLGGRAARFSAVLHGDVAAEAGCSFLRLDFTDDAALMAPDGFHPGPGIYAAWAQRAAAAIRALRADTRP